MLLNFIADGAEQIGLDQRADDTVFVSARRKKSVLAGTIGPILQSRVPEWNLRPRVRVALFVLLELCGLEQSFAETRNNRIVCKCALLGLWEAISVVGVFGLALHFARRPEAEQQNEGMAVVFFFFFLAELGGEKFCRGFGASPNTALSSQ